MSKSKVTESAAVVTPVVSMDNTAPAEQTAITAPAHVMPYSLTPITAVMQAMTSVTLTDYLTAFYADTEAAVIKGQLSPVLKLILDKGFARHWTEHNSTFSKLPDSAKLASIREAFKYWNVGVLTKSAYDSLFKAPAVVSSGKGSSVYKTLAARIITMSQSVDVELSHRKHYQKVADNLLKSGKAAYDAMLAIPTAAHIIKAAEDAIRADVPAAPAIDLDFS
jgi:type III secretion system FlhB-like substrate exporter